jgi:allophanate hydrolase subunit 2
LGSRSLYGLGALGGFSGRKLAAGDVPPVGKPQSGARAGRALSNDLTPVYPRSLELRVVAGLYFHLLTEESAKSFFEDTWTASAIVIARAAHWYSASASSRSAPVRFLQHRRCRLPLRLDPNAGPRTDHLASGRGVWRRHAMVGTVIGADMDRVAQMQPTNLARFIEVDMVAALKGACRV